MKELMKEREELFSKIAYYSFYAAVIIEVLIVIIDKSNYTNPIEGRLFQLTFLLFLIKVCLTRYTLKECIVMGLFFSLGAISYFITERNEIIRIVMFVAACKSINMKKCFKLVFWMTLIGCLVIVLLSMTGIYGAVSLTQDYGRESIETRYTFGMGHPNALHCMGFMLILLILYLYLDKMRWYCFGALMLLNIGIFYFTDSKTGMLVTSFAIVFAVLLRYVKRLQTGKIVYIILEVELIFCAITAWAAARYSEILPHYPELRKYDQMMSDRIINLFYGSASHAGAIGTWTLLGVPENNHYFDMGWVRLFYWYGIIPTIIYLLVLARLIWQLKIERAYQAVVMLAPLFIYTTIEAHIISVYIARDYTLFLLGSYWVCMLKEKNGKNLYFWQFPLAIQRGKRNERK